MKYKIFRTLAVALTLALLVALVPSTPVLAAEYLYIHPNKGEIGDSIDVEGHDFVPGAPVEIYFSSDEAEEGDYLDDEVNAYEMVTLVGAGALGAYNQGEIDTYFTVPDELTDGDDEKDVRGGKYYVYATYPWKKRIEAVAEFTVIEGEITIDPVEGPVGTEVEISGEDFGRSEDIILEYDGTELEIQSGDMETDRRGDFEDTIIIIPSSTAGDHTITAIGDDSDIQAEAVFTVEPEITISPDSGGAGTTVTVSGTGFGSRSDVSIYLNDTEVETEGTDRHGSFEVTFDVPALGAGIYDVEAEDEDDNIDKVKFTIATSTSLSPTSGCVGTKVTVSGMGFAAIKNVTITFDGEKVGTATTNAVGSFTNATFTVPKSYQGSHIIRVTDTSNNYDTASFTTKQSITINPASGGVGEEVTVNGTGFAANKNVTITFDANVVTTTPASVNIDGKGSFSGSFSVPSCAKGTYKVEASDGTNKDSKDFTVPTTASLSQTSGYVGTKVTFSGTGFKANKPITITFGDIEVGTAVSDDSGGFTASFKVPVSASGTYKVEVSDGVNKHSKYFTVLASASLSQTSEYIGTEVTVSGTGFKANKSITITLADIKVGTAVSDDNGGFTASFNVPACAPGTHKVEISDGVTTGEVDFTVLAIVSISPPGNVGTKLTIGGTKFMAGRTVTIKYDGTQVATATVNYDGSFSATFTVPKSKYGEHLITATDGTTTRQFIFTMESTAPPIPVPLKPEMGIRAEAQAYLDWEDVTDLSGVTYTLQIASDEGFTSIVLEKKDLTKSEYTLTEEEKLEPVNKKALYYWRVKAIDGASNESGWSGVGSFYIGFTLAMPQWAIYALLGVGALVLILLGFWIGRRSAYHSYP